MKCRHFQHEMTKAGTFKIRPGCEQKRYFVVIEALGKG